ncbi:hypothetical protein GYMLUDRAFT_246091 [Collybiopsis luxurians FD-317 M1]|uniref:Uncharacterized protein n=1 Tax=Collybiopsis luxurians FD-317 M1 TaxID=944289 RepID=A0A0D0CJ61_9AGAR|nr:hypothetical protein GYMLUDRAFT_246091 [Collybiopsis luxurians FD-317 M1]
MEISYIGQNFKDLEIDLHELLWLIQSSTNLSAKNIALDALSNLDIDRLADIHKLSRAQAFQLDEVIEGQFDNAWLTRDKTMRDVRAVRTQSHSPSQMMPVLFPALFLPPSSSLILAELEDNQTIKKSLAAIFATEDYRKTIKHEPIFWATWFSSFSQQFISDIHVTLDSSNQEFVFNKLLYLASMQKPPQLPVNPNIEYPRFNCHHWPLNHCTKRGDQDDAELFKSRLTRPCDVDTFLEEFASEHFYKQLLNWMTEYLGISLKSYQQNIPTHLQLLDLIVSNDKMWKEYPHVVYSSLATMGAYAASWLYWKPLDEADLKSEQDLLLNTAIKCLDSGTFWESSANVPDENVEPSTSSPQITHFFNTLAFALEEDRGGISRDLISSQLANKFIKKCTSTIEQGHRHYSIDRLLRALLDLIILPVDGVWTDTVWNQLLESNMPSEVIAYKTVLGFEDALKSLVERNHELFSKVMEYLSSNGSLERFCAQSLGPYPWNLTTRISFFLAHLNAQSGFVIPEERWHKCIFELSQDSFKYDGPGNYFSKQQFINNFPEFRTFIENGCSGPMHEDDDYDPLPEIVLPARPDSEMAPEGKDELPGESKSPEDSETIGWWSRPVQEGDIEKAVVPDPSAVNGSEGVRKIRSEDCQPHFLNYFIVELSVIDIDRRNTSTGIMLVDNPVPPSTSIPSFNNREELFNTILSGSASTLATASMSLGPSASTSSRASSPPCSTPLDINNNPDLSFLNTSSDQHLFPPTSFPSTLLNVSTTPMSSSLSKGNDTKKEDDDDGLPPPPEVANMTNCISTLEMDITKQNRLLQAIRTKLGHGAVALESASTLPTISAAASLVPSICDSDTTLSTAAALSLDSLNPSLPVPFPEPNVAEELALHATAVPSASAPTAGIQQHAPHTQHAKRSIYVSAAFCSWRAEAFRRLGLVRFEWE